jgi:hypothetical protein
MPIVSRMILLCSRPRHLSSGDVTDALARALPGLAGGPHVAAVRMTPVRGASLRWSPMFDWLIEAELADGADPTVIVDSSAWRDALADLRLLGMRPSVAVADATLTTRVKPTA